MWKPKVFSRIVVEGSLVHLYGRNGYVGYATIQSDWCISNVIAIAEKQDIFAEHPITVEK